MAMKKENEAVVNRFLLSTLYIILGEFVLLFMYKASISIRTVMTIPKVLTTLMVLSIVGIVLCIVFSVLKKKKMGYYIVICAVVLLISLFLKYYYVVALGVEINLFGSKINIPGTGVDGAVFKMIEPTSRRYGIAAIFAVLFYIYEVVYYFLNVNKPQQ